MRVSRAFRPYDLGLYLIGRHVASDIALVVVYQYREADFFVGLPESVPVRVPGKHHIDSGLVEYRQE